MLYGIGSASADQSFGLTLVMINSVAVTAAGVIGFRLLRSSKPAVGLGYLSSRVAEAILLAGGVLLGELGDVDGAATTGYLLGMIALAVGSVPFVRSLGNGRWLPRPMATWGIVGYALLGAGALLELLVGRSLSVTFAVPGGLFELALGIYLLRRGFSSADNERPARNSVADEPLLNKNGDRQ